MPRQIAARVGELLTFMPFHYNFFLFYGFHIHTHIHTHSASYPAYLEENGNAKLKIYYIAPIQILKQM